MEVQERIARVIGQPSVLGDGLVAGLPLDLNLAAVPCRDLRSYVGEGVNVFGREFDAVLFGGAVLELNREAAAVGDGEAPFPRGTEGDCSCC